MGPGNGSTRDDAQPTCSPVSIAASSPMGRDSTHQTNSDLFSTAPVDETSPATTNRVSSADGRHVLPKDLPNAVKHLNDEELDRLLVVTLAEAKLRGRHTTPTK